MFNKSFVLLAVSAMLNILFLSTNDAARILAIVPTPSYSHQNAFYPIWKELSLRGHQVTLITTDPINNSSLTNLTEIDLHDLSYGIWNRNLKGNFEKGSGNILTQVFDIFETLLEVTNNELEHPEVQAIIQDKSKHFDLIILEPTHPAFFAFAERFKCPFIIVSSFDGVSFYYRKIGNPSHPVLNPDMFMPYNQVLTFKERIISVSMELFFNNIIIHGFNLSTASTVEKHFGPGYSDMDNYEENASMMFVNSNPIFFRLRPLYPNVIQFGGGTHIKPLNPLPNDLKTFLDLAKEGFVYFSLGSNVKSQDLSPELTNILLKTFSELPYKILWKFENDKLEGLPSNVMIFKWIPQQDVLRHPNIKLFITQGGLQSLEEAIHSHVPIVGLPFFGDQLSNLKVAVDKGLGLSADPFSLTKENFYNMLTEVITNPKYKNQVKHMADLINDQPMSGLEKAIWWTEYVIRHKGALHFRSPALDIPFYQYYLLDVIGFYICTLFIISYIIFLVLRLLLKLFYKLLNYKQPKIKTQ